jgi:hypothetical protein
MNGEDQDWLDDELSKLNDLEAPESLLPRVMEVVRLKAARPWWVRLMSKNAGAFRLLLIVLAVVTLGALFWVNPIQYLGGVPVISVPLKLASILLETTESLLLQYKFFNVPLLSLMIPAAIASFCLLIATATSVRRLAALQK